MTAYHAPEEVTKALKISSSTLRKWASLLEKSGYEIQKNSQGQRWYSDADVMALRKFISFSKTGGMTLDEAADAVYWWSKGGELARPATTEQAPTIAGADMAGKVFDLFEEMSDAIKLQEQQRRQDMEKLVAVISRQSEDMAAMRAAMERIEAEKETAAALPPPEVEKKGLWSRIFRS